MAKAKAVTKVPARRRGTVADGVPIVSTIPRAAALLGVPEPELARLVDQGGLQEWGHHHDQSPVYRFQELLAAASAAGLAEVQAGRSSWLRYRAGKRRVSHYGEERDL